MVHGDSVAKLLNKIVGRHTPWVSTCKQRKVLPCSCVAVVWVRFEADVWTYKKVCYLRVSKKELPRIQEITHSSCESNGNDVRPMHCSDSSRWYKTMLFGILRMFWVLTLIFRNPCKTFHLQFRRFYPSIHVVSLLYEPLHTLFDG